MDIKYYFRIVQYLTIWDLVQAPIYLLVLSYWGKWIRDKRYPKNHPLKKYFLPGLYVKFLGAIFIAIVYEFYYGGGDTFNYLYHSQVINSSLEESSSTWFNLLLRRPHSVDPSIYQYSSQMYWYTDPSSYTVSVIGALLGLLNGTSYIPISLLFAFISYTGIWAMFTTFARLYPSLHRPLAIAFLFIPSTFVWGSALFKDTICMFALGWMTYCIFKIFVNRDLSIRNFLLLGISFYLIAVIKIYIILAFVPALCVWLILSYSHKIRSVSLRWLVSIAFVGLVFSGLVSLAGRFAKELNEYSLENIGKKAKKTQDWITLVSETTEGSGYDLGTLDGTIKSMLLKFPQAVNVTLYRPYPWEAKKPIILLSSIEATAFLIFTLMIFYRKGVKNTFKAIFSDPNLLFFFIFTIIFAFAVGISTGNFGSLSRYKIPCIPFFSGLLLILYYQTKTVKAPKKILTHAKKPVYHIP